MDLTSKEPDLSMDAGALYREELFTDRSAGAIRRLTPVTASGADDATRPVLYVGQTQLMTPYGAIPLTFEIAADSLSAAAQGFGAAAEQALQRTIEEAREMQRQAASSIVIPGAEPPGLGGIPGKPGGRIKF